MWVSSSQGYIIQYLAWEGHFLNLHTLIKIPLTKSFTVSFSDIRYFKCLCSDFVDAYYKKTEKGKKVKMTGNALRYRKPRHNVRWKTLWERKSVNSNSARRPESANSNMFEKKICTWIIEKWDLVMMPIPDKTLQVLTQMLSSTSCQVS